MRSCIIGRSTGGVVPFSTPSVHYSGSRWRGPTSGRNFVVMFPATPIADDGPHGVLLQFVWNAPLALNARITLLTLVQAIKETRVLDCT